MRLQKKSVFLASRMKTAELDHNYFFSDNGTIYKLSESLKKKIKSLDLKLYHDVMPPSISQYSDIKTMYENMGYDKDDPKIQRYYSDLDLYESYIKDNVNELIQMDEWERDNVDDLYKLYGEVDELRDAKTILIKSDQVVELIPALKNYSIEGNDSEWPFSSIAFQFDEPILLKNLNDTMLFDDFFYTKDYFQALNPSDQISCIFVYEDYIGLQKCLLYSESKQKMMPFDMDKRLNLMGDDLLFKSLINSILSYINCTNIELVENHGPRHERRRAKKQGLLPPEPYYTCQIVRDKQVVQSVSTGTGAAHGHRYDVRGHFRRLKNGQTIWVPPHQRGLAHELYVPKVYQV